MPGITRINITLGRKIWTPTDVGRTRRTTGRCGCRMSRMVGLPIETATGCTSLITAGRGLAMSRGAGGHIPMEAGWIKGIRGHGGRDRCGARASTVRSGRRLTFHFLDSEVDSVSDLGGAASVGCRLGPVTASSHGGADMAEGLARWASIGLVGLAALVDSRRCMAALDSRTSRASADRKSVVQGKRGGLG